MNRLLLVTLLTIAIVSVATAPIPSNSQNVTTTTTTTTTTKPPTTQTVVPSVPPVKSPNSGNAVGHIVVESVDAELVPKNSIEDDEKQEVDLTGANDTSDSNEGEHKIETKQATGDAPKIISHHEPITEPTELFPVLPLMEADDTEDSEEQMLTIEDDLDSETTTTTTMMMTSSYGSATSTESTTTSTVSPTTSKATVVYTSSTSSKPDGVVLPTDNSTDILRSANSTTGMKDNANFYPLTCWERLRNFVQSFTSENPSISFVMLGFIFSILVLLIILVIRECCWKSKRRYYGARRPQRVERFQFEPTADLYNTSSCSHYYQKPTLLLNQQEVTMQLVSSDISSETL